MLSAVVPVAAIFPLAAGKTWVPRVMATLAVMSIVPPAVKSWTVPCPLAATASVVTPIAASVAAAAEMNSALKGQLFNLLNVDIALAGKHYNVAYAAELCAQNLQKCYREKAAVLSLPLLLELRQHTYE